MSSIKFILRRPVSHGYGKPVHIDKSMRNGIWLHANTYIDSLMQLRILAHLDKDYCCNTVGRPSSIRTVVHISTQIFICAVSNFLAFISLSLRLCKGNIFKYLWIECAFFALNMQQHIYNIWAFPLNNENDVHTISKHYA